MADDGNSAVEDPAVPEADATAAVKNEPISDEEKEVCNEKISPSPKPAENEAEVQVKEEPMEEDTKQTNPNDITIVVKTTKEKQSVTIDKDASIKELKEVVSKSYKIPIDQICLIFAGKILKDHETLSSSNITDGLSLHLVIRATPRAQDPSEASAARINATPFGLNAFGGIQGLANFGFGSPNFIDMQQQMQSELINNPEFLRQVMDNPFVQSLMSNPQCIRQIIQANPDMQHLIESNPEIGSMLSNPDVLQQTMEVARNPSMLQALMTTARDTDTSSKEGSGGKSCASLDGEAKTSENIPLPNPWNQSTTESHTTTTESKPPTAVEDRPASIPSSVRGGLFTSPGLQSIMQQMMQNPQLVQEMMGAPYMQTVMEALAANPEVASQVMINNPVFNNNPQIQDQFRRAFPVLMQQMQNPDYRNFVSNPQALMAMMNIHQGLDQLQQAAPNMFNMFPGQPPYFISPMADPNSTQEHMPENVGGNQETFSQFMSYMVNSMAQRNSQQENQNDEERYQGEMQQLQGMGFMNKETNLQALIATFGDVNAAIERILATKN